MMLALELASCILSLCRGESVEVVVTKMVRIQFGKIVTYHYWILQEVVDAGLHCSYSYQ